MKKRTLHIFKNAFFNLIFVLSLIHYDNIRNLGNKNANLGEAFPPNLPPKIPQIYAQKTVIYDILRSDPRSQKTPENAHFPGFSRVLRSYSISGLHIHLLSHFSRKVLVLLFQALTGLEANKSFDGDAGAIRLSHLCHISSYRLLAVLCLYIYLI